MGPRVIRRKLMWNFDADPDLSSETTDKVDDLNLTVHPRHDKVVSEGKLEATDISGVV